MCLVLFLFCLSTCIVRMPSSPMSIAGVPSSRALPGFSITAPPPVCVPDVIGALAVCRQNKTKPKYCPTSSAGVLRPGASGLTYYCTPPVCIPAALGGLAVWRNNNNKKKITGKYCCCCNKNNNIGKTMIIQIHNECVKKQKFKYIRYMRNIN